MTDDMEESGVTIDYIGNHHWGVFVDGELLQEYESFNDAADEYERRGGIFS